MRMTAWNLPGEINGLGFSAEPEACWRWSPYV
jgi:hypothetical protein